MLFRCKVYDSIRGELESPQSITAVDAICLAFLERFRFSANRPPLRVAHGNVSVDDRPSQWLLSCVHGPKESALGDIVAPDFNPRHCSSERMTEEEAPFAMRHFRKHNLPVDLRRQAEPKNSRRLRDARGGGNKHCDGEQPTDYLSAIEQHGSLWATFRRPNEIGDRSARRLSRRIVPVRTPVGFHHLLEKFRDHGVRSRGCDTTQRSLANANAPLAAHLHS